MAVVMLAYNLPSEPDPTPIARKPSRVGRLRFIDVGGNEVSAEITPEDATEMVSNLILCYPVGHRPFWVRQLLTVFGRIEELASHRELYPRCLHGHVLSPGQFHIDNKGTRRCLGCSKRAKAQSWSKIKFKGVP